METISSTPPAQETDARRLELIGLAVRYPSIRSGNLAGLPESDRQELTQEDIAVLTSLKDGEVDEYQSQTEKFVESVVPHGV